MTRVAVPYYGSLVRPHVGLEKVYFVADVDLETSSVENMSVMVWNPKVKRELPDWIKKSGIDGIICSDPQPSIESFLNTKDVWVQWGQQGDVKEVIEKWARLESFNTNENWQ